MTVADVASLGAGGMAICADMRGGLYALDLGYWSVEGPPAPEPCALCCPVKP